MEFECGYSCALIAFGPVLLSHFNGTRSAFGFWVGPLYVLCTWKEKTCHSI